eukprot:5929672-Amphidinium_carterae.1
MPFKGRRKARKERTGTNASQLYRPHYWTLKQNTQAMAFSRINDLQHEALSSLHWPMDGHPPPPTVSGNLTRLTSGQNDAPGRKASQTQNLRQRVRESWKENLRASRSGLSAKPFPGFQLSLMSAAQSLHPCTAS